MNKNLLIKQNNELFDKIKLLKSKNMNLVNQVSNLNAIIKDYEIKIALLEAQIEELKNSENVVSALPIVHETINVIEDIEPQIIEENKKEEIELPDEFNFASDIIGNIVIKAAGFINLLTESENPNKKELINLILGRTEIAKAEILNIISSEVTFSAKKDLIDSQFNESIEYFKSIMEQ